MRHSSRRAILQRRLRRVQPLIVIVAPCGRLLPYPMQVLTETPVHGKHIPVYQGNPEGFNPPPDPRGGQPNVPVWQNGIDDPKRGHAHSLIKVGPQTLRFYRAWTLTSAGSTPFTRFPDQQEAVTVGLQVRRPDRSIDRTNPACNRRPLPPGPQVPSSKRHKAFVVSSTNGIRR